MDIVKFLLLKSTLFDSLGVENLNSAPSNEVAPAADSAVNILEWFSGHIKYICYSYQSITELMKK